MSSSSPRTLRICRLGRVEYVATAELQRGLRAAREAGAIDDTLLVLEHDPVITCGTRTTADEVTIARAAGDIPLVAVERGGKATYHGPGQVVVYPIVGIDVVDGDVPQLVRRLEGAIIDALGSHGLEADRREGLPGVWIDAFGLYPRKIASVGLRLTHGVTFHGIAVNVTCDLTPFDSFSPCGIPEVVMTSVVRERAAKFFEPGELEESIESLLMAGIIHAFGYEHVQPVSSEQLRAEAAEFATDEPARPFPWDREPVNA